MSTSRWLPLLVAGSLALGHLPAHAGEMPSPIVLAAPTRQTAAGPTGMARYIPMGRWAFSLFLPGLGQILLGEIDRGFLFLQGTAIAGLTLGVVGFVAPLVVAAASPAGGSVAHIWTGAVLAPVGFGVGVVGGTLWSAWDAYGIDARQHGYYGRLEWQPWWGDMAAKEPEPGPVLSFGVGLSR